MGPVIEDIVFVRNLGLKGKHKLQINGKALFMLYIDRPNKDIPVFLEILGNGTSIETCCFQFLFL